MGPSIEQGELALETHILRDAHLLWTYFSSFAKWKPCTAIVVCCSYDLRVCDHACTLFHKAIADTLVISGNTGNWTKYIWSRPEAEVFLERALRQGVPRASIVLENRATNFGENVRYTQHLFPSAETVTFVTKPSSVLRVMLTVAAQWPTVDFAVSCPSLNFPNDVSRVVGVLGSISEMVGDFERILTYPARGYQTPHAPPKEVTNAWCNLVDNGFVEHCIDREGVVQLSRETRARTSTESIGETNAV